MHSGGSLEYLLVYESTSRAERGSESEDAGQELRRKSSKAKKSILRRLWRFGQSRERFKTQRRQDTADCNMVEQSFTRRKASAQYVLDKSD